jgi:hypothetical protein
MLIKKTDLSSNFSTCDCYIFFPFFILYSQIQAFTDKNIIQKHLWRITGQEDINLDGSVTHSLAPEYSFKF